MNDFCIVVGNDYAAFANNECVFTVSQLMYQVENPLNWSGEEHVVIGQGIEESTRALLKVALQNRGVENIDDLDDLVPVDLTHKRSRKNVLISEPRRIAKGKYGFRLALDDGSDRLSDHVTGQHIGAMLLLEAARQATVVTLEYEYQTQAGPRYGFILERFNSTFSNYVFPLPTSIAVILREKGSPLDKIIAIELIISFTQAGEEVCEMLLDVKLFASASLEKVEARKARTIINTLRGQRTHKDPEAV